MTHLKSESVKYGCFSYRKGCHSVEYSESLENWLESCNDDNDGVNLKCSLLDS